MSFTRCEQRDHVAAPDRHRYPLLYRAWLKVRARRTRLAESVRFTRRVRRLIEVAHREQVRRDRIWATRVRKILEDCLPHKSGMYVGTDTGYDTDNHNAPCHIGGSNPDEGSSGQHRQGDAGQDSHSGETGGDGKSHRARKGRGKHRTDSPPPIRRSPGKSEVEKSNTGKLRATIGNENEILLAGELGSDHIRLPDSEAMDIVRKDESCREDGFEVKTFLTNKSGRIRMSRAQARRKNEWSEGHLVGIKDPSAHNDPSYDPKCGRRVHLVVIDHREAYLDAVKRGMDFNDRKLDNLYYAWGVSARSVHQMVKCDSLADLKKLRDMPDDEWEKVHEQLKGKSYPSDVDQPSVTRS